MWARIDTPATHQASVHSPTSSCPVAIFQKSLPSNMIYPHKCGPTTEVTQGVGAS